MTTVVARVSADQSDIIRLSKELSLDRLSVLWHSFMLLFITANPHKQEYYEHAKSSAVVVNFVFKK